MADEVQEFTPLARCWPEGDTAITVFRYALLRRLCRGKRVLEIGAAAGEGTALLADSAADIVAVDHQDLWSDSPARSLPNVRFVQADALELPADWQGRFDVVVALELLEHLGDPAAFQQAAAHVLAPEGTLVLSTPNFDLYSQACDGSRTPLYRHHAREYRAAELGDALLDIWRRRHVSGVSQLSFPGDALSPHSFLFLHGAEVYDLALGEKYPAYQLCSAGTFAAPLELHTAQSFLLTLSKEAAAVAGEPPLAVDPAPWPPLSLTEAAFRSAQVILRRKNEQIKSLDEVTSDRDRHIQDLQRHAGNLEGIVADREARLAMVERLLPASSARSQGTAARWSAQLFKWAVQGCSRNGSGQR